MTPAPETKGDRATRLLAQAKQAAAEVLALSTSKEEARQAASDEAYRAALIAAGSPLPQDLRAARLEAEAAQAADRAAAIARQAEARAADIARQEAERLAEQDRLIEAERQAEVERKAEARERGARTGHPEDLGPALPPAELSALRREVLGRVLAARGITDLSELDAALAFAAVVDAEWGPAP